MCKTLSLLVVESLLITCDLLSLDDIPKRGQDEEKSTALWVLLSEVMHNVDRIGKGRLRIRVGVETGKLVCEDDECGCKEEVT